MASLGYQLDTHGMKEPQLRTVSTRLAYRHVYVVFFWLLIDREGQAPLDNATIEYVVQVE